MQFGYQLVRRGRDDRKAAHPLARRRAPRFPQTGERHQSLTGKPYGIGLPFFAELLPFVEAVEGNQAAPAGEGLAKGRLGIDPLRFGIDVGEADLEVLSPKRHEPPAHDIAAALSRPRVVTNE